METNNGKGAALSSLERVFDVIEYLDTTTRETSIHQISQDLGINKSTVYRILTTMCLRGYAYQNPDNKKYALTLAFYHIGFRVKNKMPVSQLLAPYVPEMDKLRDKYDESINIGMLDTHFQKKLKLTSIMNIKSQYMLQRIDRDVGSMEAHISASGKCLMAYASSEFIEKFRGERLEDVTPFSISTWEELDEEMRKIRRDGYSVCVDEHEVGISCVAVPIFSENGTTVPAALSMSGDTNRIRAKMSPEMIADLKALAALMAKSF